MVYTDPVYTAPAADSGGDVVVENSVQVNQPAATTVASAATAQRTEQRPTAVIVMKDGRRIETPGLAMVGSTIWILNSENATRVSLSDIDVAATQKANRDRGIDIVIPTTAAP